MLTDREKAGFRGLVRRAETNAKSLIHWQVEPFRENRWLDEICVYDRQGRLVEWYSPENQVLEQESVRHRYVYDEFGRLIEKSGYREDDTAEDRTRFVYDSDGELVEQIYTSFIGFSDHHSYYDERGNVRLVDTYDRQTGSLTFVQRWNNSYREEGNILEFTFYKEEGPPDDLRRSSPDYTHVTTFDDSGNKVRLEKYLSVKLERYLFGDLYEIETFNPNGQLTESKLIENNGRVNRAHTYSYNDAGKLKTHIFEKGTENRIQYSEYDEFNNLISSKDFGNGVLLIEENHTYEYDEHGNWVTHIEYRNNVEVSRPSTTEFERKLSYFEPGIAEK